MKNSDAKIQAMVSRFFKINGRAARLSPGQVGIFGEIYQKRHNRVIAITTTQYGKSETVSMAVLLRSVVFGENFIIAAPSEKKAQIIMSALLGHCFDNDYFISQMQLDENETLDRLRRERSKKKITWKGGGWVKTVSVDARNSKNNQQAAMGEGACNVIIDESALIDDAVYSTIKRMLGGYPYADQFLFEIGNPFYRNHFYRTWTTDDNYHKIFVDYRQAVAEGRLSSEFIDEMKRLPNFSIYYECQFPDDDEIDQNGYKTIVTDSVLEAATVDAPPANPGRVLLGIDPAAGGDDTPIVARDLDNHVMWVAARRKTRDTMTIVTMIQEVMERYHVSASDVFVDAIGVGRGVVDRLHELGQSVNGVVVGERPLTDEGKRYYFNIKAENYTLLGNWLAEGGRVVRNRDWEQLTWIKYKISSDKTVQIERKQDLKKRVGRSPDEAEAAMLTFTQKLPAPVMLFV